MKTTKESTRGLRRHRLAPEQLEDRMVLSAGQGSTFAIMPDSITTPGKAQATSFTISPSLFTPGAHGKITLGVDVTAVTPPNSATSNLPSVANAVKPLIVSITGPNGQRIAAEHSHYDAQIARANHLGDTPTSAALFTVRVPKTGQAPQNYTVQVKGLQHSTGKYLLGFYLPGDAAGTGTVTKTDITTIKTLQGVMSTSSNYNFDADANRNGVINRQDLRIAQMNLGASTTVSPVLSVNLDPASDPAMNRTTPYSSVHFAGKTTPGATVTFADQANHNATTTTTADSTGAYSIMVPLVQGSNTFTVTTHDGFGQSISGPISPVVYSPPPPTGTPNTNAATPTSTTTSA